MELTLYDGMLAVAFLFTLLYIYGKYKVNFFARKGIKTLPAYPFVGNMFGTLTKREHFNTTVSNAYNAFPDEKYVGFFQFNRPNLMIKDIETIKNITIKDFDHFINHVGFVDEDSDPLFGRNLFSLKGQKWRDMRGTLSPAFTSSKMRQMFVHVAECGEQMANHYLQEIKSKNNDEHIIELEIKDTFTRFTNDVIATSAFGIKVDSLKERDNQFYLMGKEATTFTTTRFIKMMIAMINPKILRFMGVTFFGSKLSNFFRNLVMGQMKHREENNIVRQDMIQLLMEAKKGSLKYEESSTTKEAGFATVEESKLGKEVVKRKWTDDDITAQAILFFFAGFDSSATLLCFLANELAINRDIQKKLQLEIDELCEAKNGKLEYNDLQNMKYMDMVISELLRKWPPGPFTDRNCVKTYNLPPASENSKPYTINVGESLWIPIYSIHRDPKYFPDPDKFDPERFSDDNKDSIKPFTYLPFGLGPRNCIGSRFALMEAKSVIFYMLKHFDFVEISKTANPIELSPDAALVMMPKNGFWMGLKKRV